MWVNSQEALNISKKILAGSSTAAQRFVFESVQDAIGGGIMVRTYLNRFSMQGGSVIDIKVHPNMPAGTILMTSKSLPYPMSGVGNVVQIRTRQDYYQIEWPLRSRRYDMASIRTKCFSTIFRRRWPASRTLATANRRRGSRAKRGAEAVRRRFSFRGHFDEALHPAIDSGRFLITLMQRSPKTARSNCRR